jgi:hypothetical protein
MKRKPDRLAKKLVETAEGTHRVGLLNRATYEKITMRRHACSQADAMTAENIHAAAPADPDAQPLTPEARERWPYAKVRIIRRALGLPQKCTD